MLPSGTVVQAAQSIVMVALYAAGRNPELFTDPDTYIPQRWYARKPKEGGGARTDDAGDGVNDLGATPRIHRTHEYSLPVFWGGPRLCLGKDMARLEAKMIMSSLLRKFAIAPLPGLPDDDFTISPVIFHKGGLPCTVTVR